MTDETPCWICRTCDGKFPTGLSHEEACLLWGFVMGARAALAAGVEMTCAKHMKLLVVGLHDAGIAMQVAKVTGAKAKA